MPTTVQPERLTFALGAVAGAIATLGALKLIAVRKNEEHNRNVHGEQQRKRLPSYIILVRHGESEGNANASFYRTKPDNQGLFSTICFIQIVWVAARRVVRGCDNTCGKYIGLND